MNKKTESALIHNKIDVLSIDNALQTLDELVVPEELLNAAMSTQQDESSVLDENMEDMQATSEMDENLVEIEESKLPENEQLLEAESDDISIPEGEDLDDVEWVIPTE